ncbi:signal recognition particle-docking protein FtsY [archaeon]|jgi:fused signal recognition particle receptor|nr:signal recognition particle-docking protein FtsY [archaeon]
MFGSLKAKLKKWVTKNEEEPGIEKPVKKVKVKAPKKEIEKKLEKEVKKAKKKSIKEEIKEEPKDELEQSLEETIEAPVKKKGFFSKFQKKLTEEKFNELFEELEMILLQNNVAYGAVESIKDSLEEKLVNKSLKDVDLATELKDSIESILINPPSFLGEIKESLEVKKPFVILFAGINGSGKTTTIAKVANYLQKNKLSVCLAAADTFRAAAIQQLEVHANRLKVPIIKKDYGSDPAAVGFDAILYAKKNKIDVVLIDTAGRMQNKDSLMKEIEKIVRVNKPDMKIFLGESITGNDATEQAKAFNDTISITGIILSKADVDEKGGTAISVSSITKKPILFLGTGQEYKDLELFNKEDLIKKIFEE